MSSPSAGRNDLGDALYWLEHACRFLLLDVWHAVGPPDCSCAELISPARRKRYSTDETANCYHRCKPAVVRSGFTGRSGTQGRTNATSCSQYRSSGVGADANGILRPFATGHDPEESGLHRTRAQTHLGDRHDHECACQGSVRERHCCEAESSRSGRDPELSGHSQAGYSCAGAHAGRCQGCRC